MSSFATERALVTDFVAVDVETANSDLASICQIGIASFAAGKLSSSWKSFVNPEDDFDPINISIHGINEEMVEHSPTWAQLYAQIQSMIGGSIVVSHTAFDRVAVLKACEKSCLGHCAARWLDSARIVRRAWPQFSRSGYGLSNVASTLGIEFQMHDALEDARCAGEIVLRAIQDTGVGVDGWLARVDEPLEQRHIAQVGNPEGPLHGETLVFTGALSMTRRDAAEAAARVGCDVAEGVTKHTTILVVGDQDVRRLAGHEKSSKHRKAEELISKGQHIRIVCESDFLRIVTLFAQQVAHG